MCVAGDAVVDIIV